MNKSITILVIAAVVAVISYPVLSAERSAIKDKRGNTVGYLETTVDGRTAIQDKRGNTEGYLEQRYGSDDATITDEFGNREGSVDDYYGSDYEYSEGDDYRGY
jgi:hypothetical protein